jgi:hypothetical protein
VWNQSIVLEASTASFDGCGNTIYAPFDWNSNQEYVISRALSIPHSERTLKVEFQTSLSRELLRVDLFGAASYKSARYWGLKEFSIFMQCEGKNQSDCKSDTLANSGKFEAGLSYIHYEGTGWNGKVLGTGVHSNLDNLWRDASMYFSVKYSGLFYTREYSGTFTFYCFSDDQSEVVITSEDGVDNVVCQVPSCCEKRSGTVKLSAYTYYNIRITFNQGYGLSYLTVSFAHERFPERTDGSGFYFH